MNNLYQIVSIRDLNGSELRHTKYCATEKGCQEYIAHLERIGATLVSVTHYKEVK